MNAQVTETCEKQIHRSKNKSYLRRSRTLRKKMYQETNVRKYVLRVENNIKEN